jgi:hypothetical protein
MERAVPILPADDLAVAKAFYVERLGFTISFEASVDGHSGLLGVARGSIALTLDCPMSGHGRQACVALEVADADACGRRATNRGGRGPSTWSTRSATPCSSSVRRRRPDHLGSSRGGRGPRRGV